MIGKRILKRGDNEKHTVRWWLYTQIHDEQNYLLEPQLPYPHIGPRLDNLSLNNNNEGTGLKLIQYV